MVSAFQLPAGGAGALGSLERPRRRTADVIVDILEDSGVDVVFGLPGGTIAPLNDALLDRPGIRSITTRQEAGAMFAAAGYAWSTGGLGVVLVTSGPGVISTFTGLASAHCDGLPVLVLAGEVPRNNFGKRALQEGTSYGLDVLAMARPITKLALEITEPNAAPALLRRAIATALSGRRGPVLLTLPLDVSTAAIHVPRISSAPHVRLESAEADMRRVAEILDHASRPALFAGSGARWGEGPARLKALAERLCAPVFTTPKGKGVFPESHPLSLGVFGHGGHPSATDYLEGGVDVLLAIGTGMTDPATNGWSKLLHPSDHLIQIDADAMQIGRNYAVTLGLVGGASDLLGEIHAMIPVKPREAVRAGVRTHTDPSASEGAGGRITPQRALHEIQSQMPPRTIYTCDIGEHLLFATHYLKIDDPKGFLIMTGLASMGSGIGSAVGVKLGAPNRPVVAVCGDGCFSMGLGDVATAVRERLPLIFAVLNDRRYGMVELGNEAIYGRTPKYPAGRINVAELARGVGAQAVVVERPGAITQLGLHARLELGPVVLDIRVDPSARMPKNERFKALKASVDGGPT